MYTIVKLNWLRWFCGIITLSLVSIANAEPVTFIENIELQCGNGPVTAPEVTRPAIRGVTYQATMLGLREKGAPEPIEIVRKSQRSSAAKTKDGLNVNVSAYCYPRDEGGGISFIGASRSCLEGEEIYLKLTEPNCPGDPGRYIALVELTTTWRDEEDYERAKREAAKQREVRAKREQLERERARLEAEAEALKRELLGPAGEALIEAYRNATDQGSYQRGGYHRYPDAGPGSSGCCTLL